MVGSWKFPARSLNWNSRQTEIKIEPERKKSMSQINKAILVGRLVGDPKRVETRSGAPMGVFTLASNRYYNDKQGQRQEEVAFVPCVVFGAPVA
jgi:single-strand DNA-binding protein